MSLVDLAFEKPHHGPVCWRAEVDGEADDFLSEVESRVLSGDRPNIEKIAGILKEKFELSVKGDSVRRHLNGKCSCVPS